MTHGQRNTLAWVGQELDRFSAMVIWRFRLPAAVSVEEVVAGLGRLVSRHDALRTCFPGDGQQRVLGRGSVDCTVVPAGPAGTEDALAEQFSTELRAAGVDFTAGAPVRFRLGVRAGQPVVLVGGYSHMALDFGSAAVLGRELELLLSGAELDPPEHQPLEQAAAEESPHGRRQADNALRYWQAQLNSAPAAMCTYPVPKSGAGHRTGLLTSPAAGRALTAIAGRTGASRQAIVVAALSIVLCHRTGVDRSCFIVVSSNRFRLRLRGYVGSLAQDGLLSLDVSAAGFDAVVTRAVKASLAAFTNSIFDSSRLWPLIDEVGERRGIAFSRDFTINDLSSHLAGVEADGAPDAEPDRPPEFSWQDAPPFPTVLMCNPVQLAPELQLALTVDCACLEPVEAERLAWAVHALLLAAATGDVALAELPSITGLEPVSRAEDWVFQDGCWVRPSACAALLAAAAGGPVPIPEVGGRMVAELESPLRRRALALLRTGRHRLALIPPQAGSAGSSRAT